MGDVVLLVELRPAAPLGTWGWTAAGKTTVAAPAAAGADARAGGGLPAKRVRCEVPL